eukprot:scaffold13067_cov116-Skeletonema_marinoi.AAC.2
MLRLDRYSNKWHHHGEALLGGRVTCLLRISTHRRVGRSLENRCQMRADGIRTGSQPDPRYKNLIPDSRDSHEGVPEVSPESRKGHVSKDEFAAALRAYQRAIDATKSPQREAAKRNPEFLNVKRGNNS